MDNKIDTNVKSVGDDTINKNINTEEKKRQDNSSNENNHQDNTDKFKKHNKPENQKNNKNSKKQNKKPQLNIDENGMILLPVPTSVDTNKDHYQRVNYLNQASLVLDNLSLSIGNNGLARLYNKNSDKIMKKSRISLSPNIKMFKCKKCFVNLQVGINLEIKLTDNMKVGKHKTGAHSDKKLPKQHNLSKNLKSHVIAYRCTHCGYKVKNFYIGKNNQYVSFHDKNLIRMTREDTPSTTDTEVSNNNNGGL